MIQHILRRHFRKFSTYHVDISIDNGRSRHHFHTAYARSAKEAAERTLKNSLRLPKKGTLIIYHYPIVHRMPWEAPNQLVAVYDYTPREIYIVPLPLHAKRIRPCWHQLTLGLTAETHR